MNELLTANALCTVLYSGLNSELVWTLLERYFGNYDMLVVFQFCHKYISNTVFVLKLILSDLST